MEAVLALLVCPVVVGKYAGDPSVLELIVGADNYGAQPAFAAARILDALPRTGGADEVLVLERVGPVTETGADVETGSGRGNCRRSSGDRGLDRNVGRRR